MLSTLSGWQRLGVIASIFWLIGMGLFVRWNQISDYRETINSVTQYCVENKINPRPFEECYDRAVKDWGFKRQIDWEPIFYLAVIPIPFFWLFGWLIIGLFRWIVRGFKQ